MNVYFSRSVRYVLVACMIVHGVVNAASDEVITFKQSSEKGTTAMIAVASGSACALFTGLSVMLLKLIYQDRGAGAEILYPYTGLTTILAVGSAAMTVNSIVSLITPPPTILELSKNGLWHCDVGLIAWNSIKNIECTVYTALQNGGAYYGDYVLTIHTESNDMHIVRGSNLRVNYSYLINAIRKFYTSEITMKHETVNVTSVIVNTPPPIVIR